MDYTLIEEFLKKHRNRGEIKLPEIMSFAKEEIIELLNKFVKIHMDKSNISQPENENMKQVFSKEYKNKRDKGVKQVFKNKGKTEYKNKTDMSDQEYGGSDQEYKDFKEFDEGLEVILEDLKYLLTEKNRRYGNNALNPIQVFSNLSSEEGIRIRLDDKIRRIKTSTEIRKNDIADLIGYLILLSIKKEYNFENLID